MKKYLLTLTLLAWSIGSAHLANAQVLCNCQDKNQPQLQQCDQNQPRPGAYGSQLAPGACIWDCHCIANNRCEGAVEGDYNSQPGKCVPR